jgi:hypothetical protein
VVIYLGALLRDRSKLLGGFVVVGFELLQRSLFLCRQLLDKRRAQFLAVALNLELELANVCIGSID